MRILPNGTLWWRAAVILAWGAGGIWASNPLFVGFGLLVGGFTFLGFIRDRTEAFNVQQNWVIAPHSRALRIPYGGTQVLRGPELKRPILGGGIHSSFKRMEWEAFLNNQTLGFVLRPERLGRYEIHTLRCWIEGRNGLFVFSLEKTVDIQVSVVLPETGLGMNEELQLGLSTPEMSFREYQNGDPWSWIHPRATLRKGKEVVQHRTAPREEALSYICGPIEEWSTLSHPQVAALVESLQKVLESRSKLWLLSEVGGVSISPGEDWRAVEEAYCLLLNGECSWNRSDLPSSIRAVLNGKHGSQPGAVLPVS